jgi:hypothetical protein
MSLSLGGVGNPAGKQPPGRGVRQELENKQVGFST